MGIETSDEMADWLGHNYIMRKRIMTLEDIVSDYKSVDLEDIMQVAQKLKQENLYTYWVE